MTLLVSGTYCQIKQTEHTNMLLSHRNCDIHRPTTFTNIQSCAHSPYERPCGIMLVNPPKGTWTTTHKTYLINKIILKPLFLCKITFMTFFSLTATHASVFLTFLLMNDSLNYKISISHRHVNLIEINKKHKSKQTKNRQKGQCATPPSK